MLRKKNKIQSCFLTTKVPGRWGLRCCTLYWIRCTYWEWESRFRPCWALGNSLTHLSFPQYPSFSWWHESFWPVWHQLHTHFWLFSPRACFYTWAANDKACWGRRCWAVGLFNCGWFSTPLETCFNPPRSSLPLNCWTGCSCSRFWICTLCFSPLCFGSLFLGCWRLNCCCGCLVGRSSLVRFMSFRGLFGWLVGERCWFQEDYTRF